MSPTSIRDSARKQRKAPASRWYRPRVEVLEDRTLLSVGDGLNSVLGSLQQGLNDHLLLTGAAYHLPMVGRNLGNDPQSQFLQAIGTAVQSVTDPAKLQRAIPGNGGTVTVTVPAGGQGDYEIQIAGAQLTLTELFDPGLPGLTSGTDPLSRLVGDLTSKLHVSVNICYDLNLFFALDDSGNVTLDTTPNSPTTPLLAVNLAAHFVAADFGSLTGRLGPLTMDVSDGGSACTAALQLSVAGTVSTVTLQTAQATIDLGLAVDGATGANFPGLQADLHVLWNLNNTTNPFEAIANDPQQPTVGFDAGVDLASVGGWLNNTLLSDLARKLQFLQPTIDTITNVLTTPIPIIGSLIPNGHTLEQLLENYTSAGKAAGDQISALLTTLQAIVGGTETFTQFTGGTIPLASVALPVTPGADPRLATFNLGKLLGGLTPPSPSAQAQALLSSLHLPGQFQLPLLSNSLGDLQALLLDENVVLVQWQLPNLSLSTSTTIGPFPIFPPLALAVQLGFGIDGGLTIGYDTYGLTTTTPTVLGWDQDPTNRSISRFDEGVFVADARLELTGSIGLSAEADVGVAQVGGTGSFQLSFGIQSIHDSGSGAVNLTAPPPPPTLGDMSYPYHVVNYGGKPESVLQWGDVLYDGLDGPLCPFQIGGKLSIGLSVFVTLGFSPFSVTFTYDLGDITIANFTVNTCSGSTNPELAEADVNGADIGQLLADVNQGLPSLSAIDSLFTFADGKFPGSKHWVLLDLGDFAGKRNVQNNPQYPPKSESFEVTPDRDQKGLFAQAFGQQEDFPNLNAATTMILAFGDPGGSIPVNLTVDQGVHANLYFLGGPVNNHVNYQGNGDAYLQGGAADNTLIGGAGVNVLRGGDGSASDPKSNVLVGGPSRNTLEGGLAAATLVAGPQNGDVLFAGGGTGTYMLSAGAGDDTMYGSDTGYTRFQWVQGDGNLLVYRTLDAVGDGLGNELDALGKAGGQTWTVSQDNDDRVIVATPTGKTISAYGLQNLSVDSSDANNDGGDTYTVNDLSATGIQNVTLNLHEQAIPDNQSDVVTINAPPGPDDVQIAWEEDKAGQDQGQPNHPEVDAPLTHVAVSTPIGGGAGAYYYIATAVSKLSDALNVNTGPGADTIRIVSTQPGVQLTKPGGKVNVNAGAGDDAITVGAFGTLDQFLGPLSVDGGKGHNSIRFDEHFGYISDSVTLTASQLIRYSQPPSVTYDNDNQTYTETAYATVINYVATGGDFVYGISFDTAYGGTNLFLPESGKNATVIVTCYGAYNGAHDAVYVGFDGAYPSGQAQVIVNGQTLQPQFPITAAGSTLAALHSEIGVADNAQAGATLEVDDEAAKLAQTYALSTNSAQTLGLLDRSGAPEIGYQAGLGFTLNAGNHGNQVAVRAVPPKTAATLNTGSGNDVIRVGDAAAGMNDVAGQVTVNGGAGKNYLLFDDVAAGDSETYVLAADRLHREANTTDGPVNVAFAAMASVLLDASNTLQPNWVTVTGTPAGVPVAIDPGRGDDSLRVDDLDRLQGPLSMGWKNGNKTLVVEDRAAATGATYTLDTTTNGIVVRRTGAAPIKLFAPLASLYLETGKTAANVVDVVTVPAGTQAVVGVGKGNTDVEVSPGQNLDTIKGTLWLFGGATTQVTLNDQQAASGRAYVVTASDVKFKPALPAIHYDGVGALVLDAGPAATTAVRGTSQGTAVQLKLGSGTNPVTVGSAAGRLGAVNGPLAIVGRSGIDPLVLDDHAGSGAITYTIAGNTITSSLAAPIRYVNMGAVTLDGGDGLITYAVTAVPAKTPVTITAQGTEDILDGPDQDNQWKLTGPGAGTLDKRIAFTGIGSLIGGNGADNFVFQPGSSLAGAVSGGTDGVGTLDLSAYGKEVAATVSGSVGPSGVNGSLSPAAGQAFFGIDNLVGAAGSTLDGTAFTGDFAGSLHATGFAPFTLNVPGDFSGTLTATSVAGVIVGRRFSGQIATSGDFGTLFVGGDLAGSLVAATVAGVTTHDFTGQIVVSKSFSTLTVTGTQASTAHVWLNRVGAFTVANGALVAQAIPSLATVNGVSQAGVTLQADVSDVAGLFAGLVARYSPTAASYYMAGIMSVGTGYVVNIWRVQSGAMTALAMPKKIASAGATLQFKLTGSALTLSVNGVLVVTAADSALTTGGVGVRGGTGTTFANFGMS